MTQVKKEKKSTAKSKYQAHTLLKVCNIPLQDCYLVLRCVAQLEVEGKRLFKELIETQMERINNRPVKAQLTKAQKESAKKGEGAPAAEPAALTPKLPPLWTPDAELEAAMMSCSTDELFGVLEQVSGV